MALFGSFPSLARFKISCLLSNSSTWGKEGCAECASPGTGTVWFQTAGTASASLESSMFQVPSSAIVARCAAGEENGRIAAKARSTIDRVRARVIMTSHNNSLAWGCSSQTMARIGRRQYRHFLMGASGRGKPLRGCANDAGPAPALGVLQLPPEWQKETGKFKGAAEYCGATEDCPGRERFAGRVAGRVRDALWLAGSALVRRVRRRGWLRHRNRPA